ncbi:hypothetical protein HK098_002416 [Nowakowskiella sp. JEL0407]|nr:hypothetical protein HK098_002416 [Nowakowskiella sp. JEL0407]
MKFRVIVPEVVSFDELYTFIEKHLPDNFTVDSGHFAIRVSSSHSPERDLLPSDNISNILDNYKLSIMRIVYIYYLENHVVKKFSVGYDPNITHEEFLESVRYNVPFHYVGAVSIRITSFNRNAPSQSELSAHIDLLHVFQNQKLWIVNQTLITMFYDNENGDKCKLLLELWPEELNVQSLRDFVTVELGHKMFNIFAFDPSDSTLIKISAGTDLQYLLSKNCTFSLKFTEESEFRTLTRRKDPQLKPSSESIIVRSKTDSSIPIYYIQDRTRTQYYVPIPKDMSYVTLLREIIAHSPFKGTYKVDYCILITDPKATKPGTEEFTELNFDSVQTSALWVSKKIDFKIYYRIDNIDSITTLQFLPDHDFGHIKWSVIKLLELDFDCFDIVAKDCIDNTSTVVSLDMMLDAFSDHTFYLEQKEPSQLNIIDTWTCKHGNQLFEFFFSHRVSDDKDAVEIFHKALEGYEYTPGKLVHAFWDCKCLVPGKTWKKDGFLSALNRTKVVVLFISNNCLRNVLKADVQPDNMFLEWELTLQKIPSKKIEFLPIIVGRDEAFSGFGLSFPNKKHCDENSPGVLSIREVMQELFSYQFETINLSNIEQTKTTLLNLLSKVNEYAGSKREKPANSLRLLWAEEEHLQKLLSPLYTEMTTERMRLLDSHVAGTRQWLLTSLFEFLDPEKQRNDSERVLWLQGNAGVGKSVMAALASDELERRNLLAGMFFANHADSHRNSAKNLIKTLAYQLSKWNAEVGRIILQTLKDERISFQVLNEKAKVERMFRILILEPLQTIYRTDPNLKPIVLVVDALDEMGKIGYRGDILHIFSTHCKKLPSFVKVLVTSRPEEDIVKAFMGLTTRTLQATDEDNRNDAKIYVRSFLNGRMESDSDLDYACDFLVEKSNGLFVWLAMVCRELGSQNKISMELIKQLGNSDAKNLMNSLYWSAFDRLVQSEGGNLDQVHLILAAMTLLSEPLTAHDYSLLLEIPPAAAERIIGKLRPLLHENNTGLVQFFHKSAPDYLSDKGRCKDGRFSVDGYKYHGILAAKCLKVLNKELRYNIANLPMYLRHKDIPNFEELVSKSVMPHVRYSALYFWTHCVESPKNGIYATHIKEFVSDKLLNWIELLSLLKSTNVVLTCSSAIPRVYRSSDCGDFTNELLFDSVRLVQKFNAAVCGSALQVYITAIPLSPTNTKIRQHYMKKLPITNLPRVITGTGSLWPACLMTLEGHSRVVRAVAISPNGKLIASCSEDEFIKIWSKETGEELRILSGHASHIRAVSFSSDGQFLVSGSNDKTVKLWSVEAGEEVMTLNGHTSYVTSVQFSTDGEYIVSGSNDQTAKLWSVTTGKELNTFKGHSNSVTSVAIANTEDRNERVIVSGSKDGTIKIWSNLSNDAVVLWRTLVGHTDNVNSVAVSNDGRYIVSGGNDKVIKIWALKDGSEVRTLSGHKLMISSVTISEDSKFIVSGSSDREVKVWEFENGREVRTLAGHTREVTSVAVSLDGMFIVSGSWDKTVNVWSTSAAEVNGNVGGHVDWVNAIAISSDAKLLVSGSKDTNLIVWSMGTGEKIRTMQGHSKGVLTVAISINCRYIVSGSYDNTVKLWLTESGEELRTLEGHTDCVFSVAISSDSRIVVSGSRDRTIKVWMTSTGNLLSTIDGHGSSVSSVAISPDRQFIISGGGDKKVKVWSTNEFMEVKRFEGNSERVRSVAISADGKVIFSQDSNGNEMAWDFDSGERVFDDLNSIPLEPSNIDLSAITNRVPVFDWDGWVVNGQKSLCWLPGELRIGVKNGIQQCYYGCVGIDFIAVLDLSMLPLAK